MIDLVVGPMGSGKGMLFMRHIWDAIVSSDCYITTNFAVRLHPWKFQGKPMKGLLALLIEKYGQTFEVEERLRVLTDEETYRFWMHPAVGVDVDAYPKVSVTVPGETQPQELPDYSGLMLLSRKTIKFFIDEAPDYWDNMEFGKVSKECKHALRHSRKFGWDVSFSCQELSQLAKPLRVFVQNTYCLRNFWHERIGLFRHRKVIRWERFFKIPMGVNPKPMHSGKMPVDVEVLGQCYDTTAGVAVAGGFQADTKKSERGLPFWTLPAGVVAGLLLFWGGWWFMSHQLGKKLGSLGQLPVHQVLAGTPTAVAAANVVVSASKSSAVRGPASSLWTGNTEQSAGPCELEPVMMVGLVNFGKRMVVYLSDGRTFASENPALEAVTEDGCRVSGHWFPFNRLALMRQNQSAGNWTDQSTIPRQVQLAGVHETPVSIENTNLTDGSTKDPSPFSQRRVRVKDNSTGRYIGE